MLIRELRTSLPCVASASGLWERSRRMIWLNIEMPLCEVSHQIQNIKWQLPGQRDKGLLFLNKIVL